MATEAVAVLDIGVTNLKLLVIDRSGRVLASRKAPNQRRDSPPYPHADVDRIWTWIIHTLGELSNVAAIAAIVPCTHGSAAALIDDDGPVLPVMHYEAQPPADIVTAYAEMTPLFDEVFAPVNPGGLTLARQLVWQQLMFPEAFARARYIVCYPQYWAWRLCGIAASEVTSLGAQTHLWAPQRKDFSSLVDQQGWRERFPPLHRAWEPLGPIHKALSQQTGLAPDTQILCGIHDSNANYLRYLVGGQRDFSLMSTGTWIINFNRSHPIEQLVPECDTNTNTDVYGRPVACSRFMGGREHDLLAADRDTAVEVSDLAQLVSAGTMALPSFSDSGGPVPGSGGQGEIVGPKPNRAAAKNALATLYVALMARESLGHIGTKNDIIIDGALASNELFCRLVATFDTDRRVRATHQPDGTALGAALLWGFETRERPVVLSTRTVEPLRVAGLAGYVERWRETVNSRMRSPSPGPGPA